MSSYSQTDPGPKEASNRTLAVAVGRVAGGSLTDPHHASAAWSKVLLQTDLSKKIASYLDQDSLLELGRTCRALNDTIFVAYIDDKRVKGRPYGLNSQTGYLSASSPHPKGLLTAFRCCLTLHTSLQGIGYSFLPENGLAGLDQDLCDLYTIFQRQHRKMGRICLVMTAFDSAIKASPLTFSTGYHLTAEEFRDKICLVMDCAIRKGAVLLSVEGGLDLLQALSTLSHVSEPGPPVDIESPVTCLGPKDSVATKILPGAALSSPVHLETKSKSYKRRTAKMRTFFSNLKTHLQPPNDKEIPTRSSSASLDKDITVPQARPSTVDAIVVAPSAGLSLQPSPSFITGPCLEELYIQTNMLLSPLFLPWTLDLLKSNAQTLSKLRFQCSHMPSSAWRAILRGVPLPKLKELEILAELLLGVQQQLFIDPVDICLFLSQCESIRKVHLFDLQSAAPSSSALMANLHIPRLTSFTAHPSIVSWFLKLPPSAVPSLERVVIVMKYLGSSSAPFNDKTLSNCLDVIDKWGCRMLVLGFYFQTSSWDGLEEWMNDRIQRSSSDSFKNVYALEIEFSWLKLTYDNLEHVLKFVKSFRSIQSVSLGQLMVSPNPLAIVTGGAEATKTFFSKRLHSPIRKVKINGEWEIELDNPLKPGRIFGP